jgi:DNA-binding NarL/FixJ family response regulator
MSTLAGKGVATRIAWKPGVCDDDRVPVRVLIVDDHPGFRARARALLESEGFEVVGEAGDGRTAVESARGLRPDIVLMDVRMPGLDGVQATERIVASGSPSRIIILTTFDLDEYAFAGLRAGASGFMLKNAPPDDLVSAIRTVAAGDAVVAPRVTRRLLDTFARRMPTTSQMARDQRLAHLTDREREVLQAIALGQSNQEIATTLGVSEATVKSHVSRLLAKLDLRDRVQAVIFAYETRLIEPS